MMRQLGGKLVAAVTAAGLAAAISVYPANQAVMGGALAAYMVLLWLRPGLWLLIVPALLPVLDFAPWTGWFYLEELDLLLLATACIGYWHLDAEPRPAALPRFFVAALCAVALATAVSAWIGLMPLAPLDANAFSSYYSRYNSLRVAKGFAWALVLLPLLRRDAGPALERIERYFVPGMLAGLAGACLAVVLERAAFPGLLNFSSNYRPTASFSAMHTGGAALDAFLAISFPFVAAWLVPGKSHRHLGLGMLFLLLGFYAGLATFSRDMYLAYAISGGVIAVLALAQRARRGALDKRVLAAVFIALASSAFVLFRVFSSGGYRSLAAALVLLVAALVAGAAAQRPARKPLLALAAIGFLLAELGIAALFDLTGGGGKGGYAAFGMMAAAFVAAAAAMLFGPRTRSQDATLAATACVPALAAGTAWIAWHWGGVAALADAGLAIGLACALLACNRLPAQPLWRNTRPTLTLALCWAILCATVIPLAGSYYLGERFATTGSDMEQRVRHWSEAFDMMDADWQTRAFGMGLGRYPDTYFWKNEHGETPGSISYRTEGTNQFMQLVSGSYAIGYGEALRALQPVALTGGARYLLSFDVRRSSEKAYLNTSVCERWMLYPQNCSGPKLRLAPADGKWHHYSLPFVAAAPTPGLVRARTQFEMSNSAAGKSTALDVDNVSLRQADSGAELLRNGAFSYANDYWFFSSDSNHLPWHAKNFAVNMYFEQGWLGAIAMAVLLLYVAGDLAMRALHGEAMAGIFLAALAGMMVVGLFDSLVDVPRLTLVLFLVLFAAVLRPAAEPVRRRKRRRAPVQAAADLIA